MSTTNNSVNTSLNTWLAFSFFTALVVTFGLFVYAEKQVDRANNIRHNSLLIADELRQSSNDRTRMMRSYIATGKLIYKQFYQDILAIADGTLTRPQNYSSNYWELASLNEPPRRHTTAKPLSFFERFRAMGFTQQELAILGASKVDADKLKATELATMALIEQGTPTSNAKRQQALAIAFGDDYQKAKLNVLQPIVTFYNLIDHRTLNAVRHAEQTAVIIFILLIGSGASLLLMVWRINQAVRITLGGSAKEIYTQITRLGEADFSLPIQVNNLQRDSVLGWLAETQQNLHKVRQDRLQAENAKFNSDARYRALFENTRIGIVIFVADIKTPLVDGNKYFCHMMGYNVEELTQLYPTDLVADTHTNEAAPAIEIIEASHNLFREWYLKRKDGSIFTAEVLSTTMPDGTMMSMVRDVTTRKRAEESLRRSEENLSITLQSIGDAVITTDADGNITRMNPTAEKLTGWNFTEANGRPLDEIFKIINADTRETLRNPVQRVMQKGDVICLANNTVLLSRNNMEYQISDSAAPIRDAKNNIMGIVLVFSDVSERYASEAALRHADERFRRTFKLIPCALTLQAIDGTVIDCSDAFCEFTGFTYDEIIGHNPLELNLWESPEERTQMREKLLAQGQVNNHVLHMRHRDGTLRILQLSARYLTNEPQPLLLTIAQDITEQKFAELALQESALHTQTILDNMFDGIITIDIDGNIESINKAASKVFQYSQEEIVGQNVIMLMPENYKAQHKFHLNNHKQNSNTSLTNQLREVEGLRKDGTTFPMSLSISKVLRGKHITFIGVIRDVTQQRQDEEAIYRLAFYDPLTNLPNRRLLFDRLQQAMLTSSRTDQHAALMFLDLDYFKQLNDSLGHDIGDILLQQVATRLQNCVREGDSVARMGGDEFVMLIEALSIYPHEAAGQTEMIANKILNALAEPYTLREHHYTITPSIGIVLFLHQADTMEELLKRADVAMYQAKTAGRNNARFFDPTMQAAVSVRVELEKSMRRALEKNEFVLHYQLQVDGKGAPTGAEALARWFHSEHGIISPASFIPLAEETKMILPLGQWVLETACAQLVSWAQQPETQHWIMSVNVSVSQFALPEFVANIDKALKKTGANPRRLKLELTESMLVKDVEDVIVKMLEIKAMGVTFSLDDFGTGYSSLSYLKRLPLDQLKIDQSFVRDLLTDPNDATIARTIIALGHSLGLNVIAEGVETAEQRDALAKMGCDAYQGYYFARPVAVNDLAKAAQNIPT